MTINKFSSSRKSPSICIIGAGFSGLCIAIQLKRKLKCSTFTIFESRYEVGGVWLVNTYPFATADIPGHLYSFSFEPNPHWTSNYPSQKEIWTYQKSLAEKYNLYSQIQFNTDVKSLIWDEELRKWRVTVIEKNFNPVVQDYPREITFDLVINASGRLRVPNVPPEFLAFKGPMTHSGDWDATLQIDEDKTIAIVGAGASACQIIPAIAHKVKALHVYQRKSPWVIPCSQFVFPDLMKKAFEYFPILMYIFRCLIFLFNEIQVPAFRVNTLLNKIAPLKIKYSMKNNLAKKDRLYEELIPKYPFGCNKVVVSNDYHSALTLSQVHVHTSPIAEVTKETIMTEKGVVQKIDALILATGFKTQDYFSPMEIIGIQGENILNTWKTEGPKLYLGITSNSTPNLFTLYGPNTSPGHNSILFMIECQVDYTIKLIDRLVSKKCRVVKVKLPAQQKYIRKLQKELKLTIWANSGCGFSWSANSTTRWPSSCISYWNRTRKVNFTNYEFY